MKINKKTKKIINKKKARTKRYYLNIFLFLAMIPITGWAVYYLVRYVN